MEWMLRSFMAEMAKTRPIKVDMSEIERCPEWMARSNTRKKGEVGGLFVDSKPKDPFTSRLCCPNRGGKNRENLQITLNFL